MRAAGVSNIEDGVSHRGRIDPCGLAPSSPSRGGGLLLQTDNLEGGHRGRSGLRGDHAPEARHAPRAHVVVLAAHGHEELLRELHARDRRAVDAEGLKYALIAI